MWCYDVANGSWKELGGEGDLKPKARSGHTAVVCGSKMFIFGGILELTKELNDLSVFDMKAGVFTQALEDPFAGEDCNKQGTMLGGEQTQMQEETN